MARTLGRGLQGGQIQMLTCFLSHRLHLRRRVMSYRTARSPKTRIAIRLFHTASCSGTTVSIQCSGRNYHRFVWFRHIRSARSHLHC